MDRRVKRTKAAVFNAMIALMIEKETDKITVLELCKKADINKSTFYLHFKSMGACIQFCFETITNGIVSGQEKPGHVVTVYHPYDKKMVSAGSHGYN